MLIPDAVRGLDRELQRIFGGRLESLVVYGARAHAADHAHDQGHGAHAHAAPVHTLALVQSLTPDDLRGCASLVEAWHDAGLATPLMLTSDEFANSLDVFPLEFGAILADHVVVSGRGPFESLTVDAGDLRRACEVQARSHLLHLREGFLETRGRADALSVLVLQSAAAFATLVASIARLEAAPDGTAAGRHVERALGLTDTAVTDVVNLAHAHDLSSADAERLF